MKSLVFQATEQIKNEDLRTLFACESIQCLLVWVSINTWLITADQLIIFFNVLYFSLDTQSHFTLASRHSLDTHVNNEFPICCSTTHTHTHTRTFNANILLQSMNHCERNPCTKPNQLFHIPVDDVCNIPNFQWLSLSTVSHFQNIPLTRHNGNSTQHEWDRRYQNWILWSYNIYIQYHRLQVLCR